MPIMNTKFLLSSVLKKYISSPTNFYAHRRNYSVQNVNPTKKNIEILFINKDIQRILKKITGIDYDKIFAPSQTELKAPKYEFATEKRLKTLQDLAATKAHQKLQMPPVMNVREPINEILTKDPELQGYLLHKTIFTDISTDVSSRDRMITVREVDGTLRKATWEERDRMNQIFFPIAGRHLETPKLFESPYLERLLEEGSYEFVLDSACAQFEPDAPDYHRVTSQTYEHIQKMKKFHDLRSSRHFGPMAFYFACQKNIDPLLLDMISRQLISDASDTVQLLYLIHPELKSLQNIDEANEIEILQDYITNHSTQKDELELALQTLKDHETSNHPKEATI